MLRIPRLFLCAAAWLGVVASTGACGDRTRDGKLDDNFLLLSHVPQFLKPEPTINSGGAFGIVLYERSDGSEPRLILSESTTRVPMNSTPQSSIYWTRQADDDQVMRRADLDCGGLFIQVTLVWSVPPDDEDERERSSLVEDVLNRDCSSRTVNPPGEKP